MGCGRSKRKGALEVNPENGELTEEGKDISKISGVSREEYKKRHRGTSPTSTELPPDPPPPPKLQGKYFNGSLVGLISLGRLHCFNTR